MKRSFIFSINKALGALLFGVFMMLGILQASAQVSVTATAGTLGPTIYPELRLAFNAINAGTHQGAITISVTGNTLETAAAILNQNALPASYTSVLIKPAATVTPTITSAVNANGTIYLFGAHNVTIDGSNTPGGTTQDLTISNTNTAGIVIRLSNPSITVGASNNMIKNCKITGVAPASGSGVVACSGTTLYARAEFANSNDTLQNNTITNLQTALVEYGPEPTITAGAVPDANWLITGNAINTLGFNGIVMYSNTGSTISNNVIDNITIGALGNVNAMEFSWTVSNLTISGNKISNISNTNNSLAFTPLPGTQGLYFDLVNAGANINIYNNFISNVSGFGFASLANNAHGIYIDAGSGYNIYYNSMNLNTNQTSAAGTSADICLDQVIPTAPVSAVNLVDNLLVNSQTAGGNRYTLYVSAALTSAVFSNINYNDYVASGGGVLGFIGGANRTTLAAMITGFGGNANSINVTPTWISATNLHLQTIPGNFPIVAGTPIAAPPITRDIDDLGRSTTLPTIGAHEFPSTILYTPLTNTCSSGNIILSGVNILSPGGASISGPFMPRIYYRKGSEPWLSIPGTLVTGTATNSTFTFTIPSASFLSGGVTAGDVISYFVVAQTISASPVVFANPTTGFAATDVNTITTYPTTPNTYTVNAITLTGLVTNRSLCYSTAGSTVTYPYTASTGTPNQYTLTWAPGGPGGVPAFSAFTNPVSVTVPAGLAANTYVGTLTVKNSTTSCTTQYTITLIVNPPPSPVTGPTILCIGGTTTLSTTSTGGTWVSSTPGIASVNLTTGIVTGNATGTAIISYTLPTGCAADKVVTVSTPPTAITGDNHVCVGNTLALSNGTPGGTWTSGNTLRATVDINTGVVTGMDTGNVTISYHIGGCAPRTLTIHVDPLPGFITGTLYVCAGLTTTLTSSTAGGVWSSGNTAVATIGSNTGIVTGVAGGTASISYTLTGTGCIITNTVSVSPAAGAIGGGNIVCLGNTITLTNTVTGGTWASDIPGNVSIDPTTGVALGVTAGTSATITYTTNLNCTATLVVSVSTPPSSTAGTAVVCTGYTTALSNSVPGGIWTSSNMTVATVSSTGVVSGLTAGTSNISYSTPACASATYIVTVNQTPAHITGITNLCDGGSTTALSDPTPGGIWSICCGSATISPTGFVSGLTLGSVNVVTYTTPNACYTVAPLLVDTLPAPIQGPDSVCRFSSVTMADATAGGVWSSSNGSIATAIATTGVVYGANSGNVTISYTSLSGCYVTKPFRVRVPLPTSVSLTYSPSIDTLCAGTPITITATPVNGGASPTYNWQLFGSTIPSSTTSNTYTYTPIHGDVIGVYMYRSNDICSAPSPAHGVLAINVFPVISPTIRITTSADTVVNFLGQVVTFFSEITTAGTNPSYQWYVDNLPVTGATNSSYARAVYDNDTVQCVVVGNPKCDITTSAFSQKIRVYANYLGTPGVSLVKGSLTLYPNPNTGNFNLAGTVANAANGTVAVDVTNILGQVVYKGTVAVKNGKIDQQIVLGKDLPAGSYMLRVNADTENDVFHFVIGQ